MNNICFPKIILAILLIAIASFAQKSTVAVLEILPTSEDVELSIQELRHLTDELRTKAREVLPRNDYSVLTRDNIQQLMPPDEESAQCLAEGCIIEIGRAIGAEYVTQGNIGKFGEMFTLTVELYESMTGNLLSSFVSESKDIMGLLNTIREKSLGLFEHMPMSAPLSEELRAKPSTNIFQPAKTSTWVAVGLDVLGAAVLGFGIYQHANASDLRKDYKKMPAEAPSNSQELEAFDKQKKREKQKLNDAETLRTVGIALGGALLAAGISVHIWF